MPAILTWIVSTFSAIVVFFAQYFVVSTAKTAAIITVFAGLVIAFTVAIDALIFSVLALAPPTGWYAFGASLMPSNSVPDISAYLSAMVVRWLYCQKIQFAKYISDGYGGVKKAR